MITTTPTGTVPAPGDQVPLAVGIAQAAGRLTLAEALWVDGDPTELLGQTVIVDDEGQPMSLQQVRDEMSRRGLRAAELWDPSVVHVSVFDPDWEDAAIAARDSGQGVVVLDEDGEVWDHWEIDMLSDRQELAAEQDREWAVWRAGEVDDDPSDWLCSSRVWTTDQQVAVLNWRDGLVGAGF